MKSDDVDGGGLKDDSTFQRRLLRITRWDLGMGLGSTGLPWLVRRRVHLMQHLRVPPLRQAFVTARGKVEDLSEESCS